MTDIKELLDSCPYITGYQVEKLETGLSTGVYPQGITNTVTDILGHRRYKKSYKLRRRDIRGATWAADMTRWALDRGLEVSGGGLEQPASDGAGVYTLTITMNIWEEHNEN